MWDNAAKSFEKFEMFDGLNFEEDLVIKYANPDMDNLLKDICLCNVEKVVRNLYNSDISFLDKFMNFPKKENGKINMTLARMKIKQFLNEHWTVRTTDPDKLCLKISR